MAKTQENPGEHSTKSLGMGICAVAVLVVLFFWLPDDLWSIFSSGNSPQTHSSIQYPITRDLEMSTDVWTSSVEPEMVPQKNVVWGTVRDDLHYYVEINGGKANGGQEYEVPPRRDWTLLNWKAPYFANNIRRVRFKLIEPTTGKAEVTCTISIL